MNSLDLKMGAATESIDMEEGSLLVGMGMCLID